MEREVFDINSIRKNIKLISSGEMESYTTFPLNANQRLEVHKLVESFCNLRSISSPVLGSQHKNIKIVRNEKGQKEFELTSDAIKFFSLYARVPLPNCDLRFLDYYLKELDPYFDCVRLFSLFNNELKKKQLHELKSEATQVRRKIIDHIKSSEEFSKFVEMNIDIPTGILTKNKLYHQQHAGQYFVSIDVRSANYRVLKKFCPNLANTEWKEFISKFTNTQFIIESKYFREVIFGELGHSKITKLPLIFVDNVGRMIESDPNLVGKMEKVFCSDDEIVYKVKKEFDTNILEKNIEELLPGHFRVEKYKLSQIGQFTYFVREFAEKKDFKNVPKKFIMQCVKYYKHRPITEVDRKFEDEDGLLATYDKSIFDN